MSFPVTAIALAWVRAVRDELVAVERGPLAEIEIVPVQQYTPGACVESQLALSAGALPLVHVAGTAGSGTGQSPAARAATGVGPGGVSDDGNAHAGGDFATSTAPAESCVPVAVIPPLLHSTPCEMSLSLPLMLIAPHAVPAAYANRCPLAPPFDPTSRFAWSYAYLDGGAARREAVLSGCPAGRRRTSSRPRSSACSVVTSFAASYASLAPFASLTMLSAAS